MNLPTIILLPTLYPDYPQPNEIEDFECEPMKDEKEMWQYVQDSSYDSSIIEDWIKLYKGACRGLRYFNLITLPWFEELYNSPIQIK